MLHIFLVILKIIAIVLAILLGIVLFVPFMKNLFLVESLTRMQIFSVICLAFAPTLFIQIVRLIKKDK